MKLACGACERCARKGNCGRCAACKDKPKFGGPGVKKRGCEERECKTKIESFQDGSVGPKVAEEVLERYKPLRALVDRRGAPAAVLAEEPAGGLAEAERLALESLLDFKRACKGKSLKAKTQLMAAQNKLAERREKAGGGLLLEGLDLGVFETSRTNQQLRIAVYKAVLFRDDWRFVHECVRFAFVDNARKFDPQNLEAAARYLCARGVDLYCVLLEMNAVRRQG
jgi:hypothetical protein